MCTFASVRLHLARAYESGEEHDNKSNTEKRLAYSVN